MVRKILIMKKILYILLLFSCSVFSQHETMLLLSQQQYNNESSGSSFTAEYQAVLDEATAQGYTLPSAPDQIIQNARIISAIASGVWALTDWISVFTENGSKEFKMINWKNPSQTKASPYTGSGGGTSGNLVNFINSNTGITSDGVHWLNLYNPTSASSNFLLNDAGAYVNIITASVSLKMILSSAGSINGTIKMTQLNSSESVRLNSSTPQVFDFVGETGLLGLSRQNATEVIASINTTTTTLTDTSSSVSNSTISLWGHQWATPADWTRGDSKIGYVIIGADMSSKLADIKNAFD